MVFGRKRSSGMDNSGKGALPAAPEHVCQELEAHIQQSLEIAHDLLGTSQIGRAHPVPSQTSNGKLPLRELIRNRARDKRLQI
jgi:hypothetical protein